MLEKFLGAAIHNGAWTKSQCACMVRSGDGNGDVSIEDDPAGGRGGLPERASNSSGGGGGRQGLQADCTNL